VAQSNSVTKSKLGNTYYLLSIRIVLFLFNLEAWIVKQRLVLWRESTGIAELIAILNSAMYFMCRDARISWHLRLAS